jgi:hypothetical protein
VAKLSFEQFIKKAKQLRTEMDRAARSFVVFLIDVEENHPEVWKDKGITFIELLDQQDICKPSSYERCKRIIKAHGPATDGLGFYAILAASKLDTPRGQREMLDQARTFEHTNGVAISEKSANDKAREIKLRFEPTKTRMRGLAELEVENQRLRTRVSELEQENKNLRLELRTAQRVAKAPGKRATA